MALPQHTCRAMSASVVASCVLEERKYVTGDEKNKGRATGCRADDTTVLQEERGQRKSVP